MKRKKRKNNKNKKPMFGEKALAFFCLCALIVGFSLGQLIDLDEEDTSLEYCFDKYSGDIKSYVNYKCSRKYDGLFLSGVNKTRAKEITREYDLRGDWVCVNVRDMTFPRALEVCKHEVFHEIWAECGEANDLEYCINKYNEEIEKDVSI